jgi:hypothetical protein
LHISYGKHGGAVITNIVMAMYNHLTPANTITSASSPLMVTTYMKFVIVPFITASLIRQDINTDVEGGWETMQSEGDQGDNKNSLMNDDTASNAVFTVNAQWHAFTLKGADNKKGKEKQVAQDTKGNK